MADLEILKLMIADFPDSHYFELDRPNKPIRYEDHLLRCLWFDSSSWAYTRTEKLLNVFPVLSGKSYEFLQSNAEQAEGLKSECADFLSLSADQGQSKNELDYAIELRHAGQIKLLRQLNIKPVTALPEFRICQDPFSRLLMLCHVGHINDICELIETDTGNFSWEQLDRASFECRLYRHFKTADYLQDASKQKRTRLSRFQGVMENFNACKSSKILRESSILHQVVEQDVCRFECPDEKLIEYFIAQGEQINNIDLFSRTPLDVAIERAHIAAIHYLRRAGAKTFIEIQNTLLKFENKHFLSAHEMEISFLSASQPFQYVEKPCLRLGLSDRFLTACGRGDAERVLNEIQSGVDLIYGLEAFEVALKRGHFDVLKLIVEKGLHVSLLRPYIVSLLKREYSHLACENELLGLFLSTGTAVNFFDKSRDSIKTPLDLAIEAKQTTWVYQLQQVGARSFQDILTMEI